MYRDTEIYKHAVDELDRLVELERESNLNTPIEELEKETQIFDGMTPQEYVNTQILDVIAALNTSELSYGALHYIMEIAFTLMRFENVSPLTLKDDEFVEVATEEDGSKLYQNKRNFNVFKSDSKGIYHLDGPAALERACGSHIKSPIEE